MHRYYSSRFQIEFLIRDAKQHTGLNEFQTRAALQIHNHINASIAAVNIMKLEDQRKYTNPCASVISIASWKRRKMNQMFMRKVFRKLDIDPTSEKALSVMKSLENWACIAA